MLTSPLPTSGATTGAAATGATGAGTFFGGSGVGAFADGLGTGVGFSILAGEGDGDKSFSAAATTTAEIIKMLCINAIGAENDSLGYVAQAEKSARC